MNFKKYAVALTLGFFALSVDGNAAECPVGAHINVIGKQCKATEKSYSQLSPEERGNQNNRIVKKYKELFVSENPHMQPPCESVRSGGAYQVQARCEILKDPEVFKEDGKDEDEDISKAMCAAESTSCRWSSSEEECVNRKVSTVNFECLDAPATSGTAAPASIERASGGSGS